MPYVFGSLERSTRPYGADDRALAETMSSYWAAFAATGDPNGARRASWPAYSRTTPRIMELGDHPQATPVLAPAKLAFFKRFFASKPRCGYKEPCSITTIETR